MNAPDIDPLRENRRLRAAQAGMQTQQKLARGGAIAGGIIFYAAVRMNRAIEAEHSSVWVWYALALGLVVMILCALPFLRSLCPKCRKRYHGPSSLLRSMDRPPPCRHCGFEIDKHISRYS